MEQKTITITITITVTVIVLPGVAVLIWFMRKKCWSKKVNNSEDKLETTEMPENPKNENLEKLESTGKKIGKAILKEEGCKMVQFLVF